MTTATAPAGALLTAEEECDLARRRDAGDRDAWRELVGRNLGLSRSVARAMCPAGMPSDDAEQDGNVGLMVAAEKYDPARGTRFSTVAGPWIRSEVRRGLIRDGESVHVPAHVRVQLAAHAAGRPGYAKPLKDEGCYQAGRRLLSSGRHLSAALDELPSRHEDEVERRDEADRLMVELARLPDREAMVLRLRFGLEDGRERTHKEIGERIGCTREWARQIEIRALARLREALGAGEVAA